MWPCGAECVNRIFKRARPGHATVKWPGRNIEGSTLVKSLYIDGDLNYVLLDTGTGAIPRVPPRYTLGRL